MKSTPIITLAYFVIGILFLTNTNCILEPDKEFIYSDTTMISDTINFHDTTIVYSDTLRIRDTVSVHDTITEHDTLRIRDTVSVHDTITEHDTLRTFATSTTSDQLFGIWDGNVGGTTIRLAITTPSQYSSHIFNFNCNIGTKTYDGYFSVLEGNVASSAYISGPSAYGEDAAWIFSISNNILTLQQTGFQMFPTSQAFSLNRLN